MDGIQRWIAQGEDRLDVVVYPRKQAPLVLFCHGFPGIHRHRDLARRLWRQGLAVAMLSYRGCGSSTGCFNFCRAREDVRVAVEVLRAESGRDIGFFGYSFGGYYGMTIAATEPGIAALALLSPVVDLPRTARVKFENVYDLMLDAHHTIRVEGVHDLVASFAELWKEDPMPERARTLRGMPLLILEGDGPEECDPGQARLLYEIVPGPDKALSVLSGAGHFFRDPAAREHLGTRLAAFFTRTLLDKPRLPDGVVT